ncbi:MAG TPA: hypothetical protein VF730_02810 [Terracidiphilus sp.]
MRWRSILCLWGLVLFGLLTYGSVRANRYLHTQHLYGRFFWWGSLRLDTDPLNKHPLLNQPCEQDTDQTCGFEPLYVEVTPGWIEKALILSALPAFVLVLAVVRGLAHFGISEVSSFMIAAPFLTLSWFYSIGWFLDRWRYKRALHRPSLDSSPT